MIVTIDGTASSGKSTIAKRLAQKLGFVYCNTGAIYRAMTILILENFNEDYFNEDDFYNLVKDMSVVEGFKNGEFFITLNGKDVSGEINQHHISQAVVRYAKLPKLREVVRKIQRQIATSNDSVVEGRDIGTVVFPNAEVKFFMSASVEVRAQRRKADYDKKGEHISLSKVIEEIKERDRLDMEREVSPLKPASDAIIVDNSGNDVDKMVDYLASIVKKYKTTKN